MNRRGIALLAALAGLLLVTGLATAMLATARLRLLAGTRQLASRRALEAARGAVDRRAANWDTAATGSLALGMIVGLPPVPAPPGVTTHDSLVRIGAGLFLVRSSALATADGGGVLARDGVGRLLQLVPDEVLLDSAARVDLEARLLRESRDNVALLHRVTFVTNGWIRWP